MKNIKTIFDCIAKNRFKINRLYLILLGFLFYLTNKTKVNIQLKLKVCNARLIVRNWGDFISFYEIFIKEIYKTDYNNPQNILDLGANIGYSSAYFSLNYPWCKIVALEPDPEAFKILLLNVNQFKNVTTINKAINTYNGISDFYKHDLRCQGSSLIHNKNNNILISVECLKMSELKIDKIDILKCDIEGGEWNIFKSKNDFKNIKYFVGEIHKNLNKFVNDFIDISEIKNYELFYGRDNNAILKGVLCLN